MSAPGDWTCKAGRPRCRFPVACREPSSSPQPWQGPGAGSTAVAALVMGSTLYVANAGEWGSNTGTRVKRGNLD